MKPAYLLILFFLLSGCRQRRPAEVYEFPKDFQGWAVIVWGVTNYPQIPTDHGKLIERFPTNGIIITSSMQQFGWAQDEAYFYDVNGNRLLALPTIAVESVGYEGDNKRKLDYAQAFIGTEAQLESAPREAPQVQKLWDAGYYSQLDPH
jgi:hypothetical protein